MKVYIASSFSLKETVQRVAQDLKSMGFEITYEWWYKNYKDLDMPDDEWYANPVIKIISKVMFEAIDDADLFLLVFPLSVPMRMKGADVEFGYAYAKGKPCYSVGVPMCSAMYQPLIKLNSLIELQEEFHKLIKNGVEE